jgi:hypothetical protein
VPIRKANSASTPTPKKREAGSVAPSAKHSSARMRPAIGPSVRISRCDAPEAQPTLWPTTGTPGSSANRSCIA